MFPSAGTPRLARAPEEKGKGYATEAVRIIVDNLFLSHDIVRIQAETHPENTAHQRALESNGFTHEAIIRKSLFSRGAWRDSVLYSILREDWEKRETEVIRTPL